MEFWVFGLLALLAVLIFSRRRIYQEWQSIRSDSKGWLKKIWKEWGEPFLVAALIALVIRSFILGPYKIPTGSMRSTLLEGDRIFVDKVTYRFRLPKRGEVIVFKYPMDPKKDFVKRLIAFAGEEVEIRDGSVYIDGKRQVELDGVPSPYYYNRNDWSFGKEGQRFPVPADSFFVLGDNSAHSSDSRYWGFVPRKNLIGRAFLIWWPFNRVSLVD